MILRLVMIGFWTLVGCYGFAFFGVILFGVLAGMFAPQLEPWWLTVNFVCGFLGGLLFLILGVARRLPGTKYGRKECAS